MADRGGARGGGFGDRGRGDRGRGRGRGRGRRGGKSEEKEWQPVTKLGRLVKAGKIKSMEEIYLHSLPIKEYQIVDFFLPKLKDEVMKVRSLEQLPNSSLTLSSTTRPQEACGGLMLACSVTPPATHGLKYRRLTVFTPTDQARPEADPRRSANPIQGYCHHWRLRGPRRPRHQDFKGGRYRHPCRYHYRQAERHPRSTRILGCQPWSTPLHSRQGVWKVRFRHRSCK
jgi:hypothetical protein